MTSPLRRKLPITVLNTLPAARTNPRWFCAPSVWLEILQQKRLLLVMATMATFFGLLADNGSIAQESQLLTRVISNARPAWTVRRETASTGNQNATPRTIASTGTPVLTATTKSPIGRSNEASSTVILKWRARLSADSKTLRDRQTVASRAAPIMQASHVDQRTRTTFQRSYVQQAAQLKPLDPFEDPFGDKSNTSGTNAAPVPPADILPELLTQQQDNAPESKLLQPKNAPTIPQRQADRIRFDAQPPTPGGLLADDSSCDRVYNQRDCCKEDGKCQKARKYLQSNPITKIKLDITPAFKINNADARISRVWKNCQNKELAVGSMVGFRNGRIIVSQNNGTKAELPYKDLSDDDLCFVTAWIGLPSECRFGEMCETSNIDADREWTPSTFTWTASALCHKPLYFEDVQLERYGHSAGPLLQPILSGGHFFLNIAILPYRMGINPPNECQYALGYYRPGSCAPWMIEPFPLSLRGGLLQAGVVTGAVFALP